MSFDNIATDVADENTAPSFHSKVTGNPEKVYKKLLKQDFYKEINRDKIPANGQVVWLPTDILTPLESQRDTKVSWAPAKFDSRGGFDWTCFAPISVSHKLPDTNYYVFDGCGRVLMAQLMEVKEVPCWVYNISKEEAAGLFSYTQSDGRRELSQEIIFANQVTFGDKTALNHEAWLKKFGLLVQAAEDVLRGDPNGDLVKYRLVKLVYGKYTDDEVNQVLTWMRLAWPNAGYIQQDIFLGLLHFVHKIPDAMRNGLNKAITNYFTNLEDTFSTPKATQWMHKGGNQKNQVKESVALGFYEDFRRTKHFNPSFRQVIKVWKFKPYDVVDGRRKWPSDME